MSQITSYSALYPQLTLDLPSCPQRVMLAALQRAGREFARDSRAFRMRLDPLPVIDHQADYDLKKGKAHGYDAQVYQILDAAINGVRIGLENVRLFETQWLRLAPESAPVDEDEERLLTCGTAGITAHAGWAAITNGSVTFTVNASTYGATELNFSGCLSMDDVARVIETGFRTAMDYNRVYVRWAEAGTNNFLLWTDDGEITYLTAGTSGTDISGAGHMNGLSGATGARIDPVLEIEAVLVPDILTDILPDWFLDRYAETIAARATAIAAAQRGTAHSPIPWHNPDLVGLKQYEYLNGVQTALQNNEKRDRDVLSRIL
jgi:hypothetical protein